MTPAAAQAQRHMRGFTLIELLVAISIMAVLTLLAWGGLDAMARARQTTAAHSYRLLALQTALAQWRTDLDATAPEMAAQQGGGAFDWNGRTLRLLRLAPADSNADAMQASAASTSNASAVTAMPAVSAGTMVVAWTQAAACPGMHGDSVDSSSCWMRWQSPVLHTLGEQQSAWKQAAAWAEQGGAASSGMQQPISPLAQWSILVWQNNAWIAPVPATTAQNAATSTALPDGVRLELVLPDHAVLPGKITADWILPTLTRGRQ